MKLLQKAIEKDLSGSVTLVAEDDEDMWQVYNMLQRGDEVRALSDRKIIQETSTGSRQSQRKQMSIAVRVHKLAFSARPDEADDFDDEGVRSAVTEWTSIRITGPITNESADLKTGSYHTLELMPGVKFTLSKGEGAWDAIAQESLDRASHPAAVRASIGAILCADGIANICIVTRNTTIVRQRIHVPIPKKAGPLVASSIEKASQKYFAQIYDGVQRHLDLAMLKVVLVASPNSFLREAVVQSIMQQAQAAGNKELLAAKSKFCSVYAPSHHIHALSSVLASPDVASRIQDLHFGEDARLLGQFYKMLNDDEDRAWYGPEHVRKAADRAAVGTLLLSDRLLRAPDADSRTWARSLVDIVRSTGGSVHVLSGLQPAGKQLEDLSGVAALLRYPLSLDTLELDEE